MDQAPYTSPIPPAPAQQAPASSSLGPVIGAIIVILVLGLGALYFWGAQLNEQPDELPFIPGDGTSESWMPQSSGSDEAAAIEAELQATDMSAFEQQMNADLEATESGL
ncbi:hypothetical protein C4556_01270 [Candidatus Parcubacteria bacterium]|nr:MAG: hypothetical protein C4556_01270 [Candidatus Parcubacteria bacterium]